MNALNISLAVASIVNFLLSLFVLVRNLKQRSNLWFGLFAISTSFWILSEFFLFAFKSNFAGHIDFVFAAFLPPLLYLSLLSRR